MSHILPENLKPVMGQGDPMLEHKPAYEIETTIGGLSIAKTAVAIFPESENKTHLLHFDGNEEEEIWPLDDEIIDQLLINGYPRLTAQWPVYAFWRKGVNPTSDEVCDLYGYAAEDVTIETDSSKYMQKFTSLDAIFRRYEDTPDADHLELKYPAGTYVRERLTIDQVIDKIEPAGHPSRIDQYMELWLPSLGMDLAAQKWYGEIKAKRDKAEAEEAEEAAREAAKLNADSLIQQVLADYESNREEYGEEAA